MTTPQVELLPNQPALIQRALALVVETIQSAITDHAYCTIALAGGNTPKPLYEALAQQALPWEQLYIFWGDERYVPVTHADSNAGMAKSVWLDRVKIPPQQVYIAPTTVPDPALAAQQYDTTIQTVFQRLTGTTAMPEFDLVLLGMGDDGHTASLFPHTPALTVTDRLVTVGQKGDDPRLTLTVPLLNHSRRIIFLAAGANKQPALRQVFAANGDAMAFPSRLIQPQGELWWLLDAAAAQALSTADQA